MFPDFAAAIKHRFRVVATDLTAAGEGILLHGAKAWVIKYWEALHMSGVLYLGSFLL